MIQNAGIVLVVLVIAVAYVLRAKGGKAERFSEMRFDAADITALDVRDTDNSIELTPSSDNMLHITYFDSEEKHYEIDADNGKLSMVYHSRWPWNMLLWNWSKERPVTIEAPNQTLTSLRAQTTNGKIRASNLEICGDIRLSTTNNQIAASKLTAKGKVEVASVNGTINLEGVKAAGDMTVTGTNGDTQIRGLEAQGAVFLKRTNGAIEAKDIAAQLLETHNVNGNTGVHAVAVKESIILSSTNGKIIGGLSGVMSDYRITSHTVNGKNNLPSQTDSGHKQLKVTTTNGKIDISFGGICS